MVNLIKAFSTFKFKFLNFITTADEITAIIMAFNSLALHVRQLGNYILFGKVGLDFFHSFHS